MADTTLNSARGDALLEGPSDAELIGAVRDGDTEAYGVLFERHVDSARRLAHSLSRDGEADDLVSEAFAKVLVVLQRGEGPDTALRPYLLTALRRLHVDRVRSVSRTRPTEDMGIYDEGEAFSDTAVMGFESGAAARAFASLPERWQLVLWHLEVEGSKPADVAPLLGISANSVSALAYRAREGLRQAFVSMHAQDAENQRCQTTRSQLGAFIRQDISKRDSTHVEAHLRECRECSGIYLELVEVNSDLRALLAPLVLGGAASAYLAGVPGAAAATGLTGAIGTLWHSLGQSVSQSVGHVFGGGSAGGATGGATGGAATATSAGTATGTAAGATTTGAAATGAATTGAAGAGATGAAGAGAAGAGAATAGAATSAAATAGAATAGATTAGAATAGAATAAAATAGAATAGAATAGATAAGATGAAGLLSAIVATPVGMAAAGVAVTAVATTTVIAGVQVIKDPEPTPPAASASQEPGAGTEGAETGEGAPDTKEGDGPAAQEGAGSSDARETDAGGDENSDAGSDSSDGTTSEPGDGPGGGTEPAKPSDPAQPSEPAEPEEPAEPAPSPTPTPTGSDVAMSGSASSRTGITYVVKLSAERLKDGEQGTVVVTLDRPALGLHLDPRCDLISFGKLTCRVTDSGRIKLLVTPKPGAPTTLTAVLSVAGDPDPKPGDNTTRVQLG